ncbi:hypothetical protein [Nitrosopumilus sp.]|uniref:hypothetical protein n=1 Tax=Nitrosopumilus sp. TaxID=2024843 RepID=UPI00247B74B8|nr:hypothetical protein [Nitrosopumilus sp.]MCV0430473.1 serine protease [Nitrosopumilus sp.]
MVSIIKQIKKSVGFIYVKNGNVFHPAGTGFFVSVATGYDSSKSYFYFVTAKHVIQKKDGTFYDIAVRLNTFDNSSNLLPLPMNQLHIFTHDDEDVDIALFPMIPNEKIYDILTIGSDILSTEKIIEDEKIEEGGDVLFSGLFSSHIGKQRNQPIVRFGKISLISDEKITWKVDDDPPKLVDLYLMECQSYGGNSGSPVFFKLDRFRESSENKIKMHEKYYLAGVMTGSFNQSRKIENIETINEQFSWQNIGIAAVTPAYKLHDILFSDELNKIRKDNDDLENAKKKV